MPKEGFPLLSSSSWMRPTAASVTERIGAAMLSCCALSSVLLAIVLGFVVLNSSLDGIFGQYRAVDLHWRQREMLCDFRVLDAHGFVKRLALDPFGHQRGRSDCRAAAKGLEL